MIILIILNAIIFLTLSGAHIYWAFGGRMGWGASVPSRPDGTLLMNPGLKASLIVATGLLLFAVITLANSNLIGIDQKFVTIGDWVIITIFALRTIGDFKMVGFFKRIKGTPFAINDTRYYSPLCLYLSISTLLILFN